MADAFGLELEFADDDAQTGFRLQSLELYNWGTFDGQVWTLDLGGRNCLLTGDIGSGKSTIVDAVTSLLVPAHKVAFNKAAGAEHRERSLRSYVLGAYKSERNDVGSGGKQVTLRDRNSYSVILGLFHNVGFNQTITLAQVFFWSDQTQSQPSRLFVAVEEELSIAKHFSSFGGDIRALRKRLREKEALVSDSYPSYGAWFRRRFGIANDQALELFHQTVSMKTVGNLTEFVRTHMLEPFDTEERIGKLITHFEDLNKAHESVLKAKEQLALLEPLVSDARDHRNIWIQVQELTHCRQSLKAHFARHKLELLSQMSAKLESERERLMQGVHLASDRYDLQQQETMGIHAAIVAQGGERIEQLRRAIDEKARERDRRLRRFERYGQLATELGFNDAADIETFSMQRQQILTLRIELDQQSAELQNTQTEREYEFRLLRDEHGRVQEELESLRSRTSNIDRNQVEIRRQLCSSIGIEPEELPFVGELLQIREEEQEWRGAIERVLRNFGLSMLVPDEVYQPVADWVNRTHLSGRLVYFRVKTASQTTDKSVHPKSLVRKLVIKPDSPHYPWLEQQLLNRFDYACCTSQQEFRREREAITVQGQLKTGGSRHEKDDRWAIGDRSRYILGWSNADKIAELERRQSKNEQSLGELGATIAQLQGKVKAIQDRREFLSKLEEFGDFQELDWKSPASEFQQMTQELEQLETGSDILQQLRQSLVLAQDQLTSCRTKLEAKQAELTKTEERLERNGEEFRDAQESLERALALNPDEAPSERLESLRLEVTPDVQLTVKNCESVESELRNWIQGEIDRKNKTLGRLGERIIKSMAEFRRRFPLESSELDGTIEAADAWEELLVQLEEDDLPRFEQKFKELLNENTIREVTNFQSQLNKERELIAERIVHINDSLYDIDFNKGRFIRIETQPSSDSEIRDFQSDLRSCTEGVVSASQSDQYSEAKFLQVKRIIDRLRGRDGLVDLDRRWTAKVTDVRNWFSFGASERWREDDSEHEHYSDSGGKSGGQKEKLAYTILAASLAYQFGLEWNAVRSRSFRFVVIDEAFGKGSDESARYGLRLFSQLHLQLLVVTPLQKIHIIEPFVANLGFVHNQDGRKSKLRNLGIEEYRQMKETGVVVDQPS